MHAATSKERTMTKEVPVKEVSNKVNEVSTYQDVSAQTLGQVEDRSRKHLKICTKILPALQLKLIGSSEEFQSSSHLSRRCLTQSVPQMSTDNKTRDSVTSYDETKFVERLDKKTRTTEVQTDIKPLCVCARTQTEDGHQIRTKYDSSSGESSKKITFVCSDPRCEKFHRKDGEDDVKGKSRSRTHDVGTYKTNNHDTGTYDAATRDGSSLEIGTTYLEGFGTGTQGTYSRSWQELSGPRDVQTEKQGIDFGEGITSKDGVCVCGFIKKVHGAMRLKRSGNRRKWIIRIVVLEMEHPKWHLLCLRLTAQLQVTRSPPSQTRPSCKFAYAANEERPPKTCRCSAATIMTFPLFRRENAVADRFCRVGEYCSCTKPSRMQNSRYCSHCQFKLRRTQRSKNGIAYTLTLEDESPRKLEKQKKKTKKLEEIRMKVPCPSNRKGTKKRRT
ncbi:hypothetical protein JTB14_021397 [Gonioctena quinquepunctata]|nr:hypothetical protein JTB14_021397 [Gonioctena quinquepunctata]